ncbi:Serine/threonine-protein kinase ATG1a [Vitis vinifera]|uniref:Serine/threonine-protein kinase ATG1a n=1 Tax=Vitis vinifera TaxID=29760 RepID=A0A438IFN5_VITVI|nr:Serine/threonine-protein kinase ATG1a [Vitis vinifera]
MGDPDCKQCRVVGEYILGPRIGSGSYAVVWESRHRQSGMVVAIKEIDKEHLNPKVKDNLFKEIEILRTINHPNIIRLLQAIETSDRIFLVLEYCDGGDLAAYIHRRGRVPEAVARHFMRQLAAGLQVLHEKRLIHRDLKPQNLLLSTNEATTAPLLKIGDFGFARDLTQGLADTQCGSPLYMAPEIIQNQKYDAKADLWSVGAILFQLVTGRPPFDGSTQFQVLITVVVNSLREIIMSYGFRKVPYKNFIQTVWIFADAFYVKTQSLEFNLGCIGDPPTRSWINLYSLEFNLGSKSGPLLVPSHQLKLHCHQQTGYTHPEVWIPMKSPKGLAMEVERLTFNEFFNHKFLVEPRLTVDVEQPSLLPQTKPLVVQFECLRGKNLPTDSTQSPQLPFAHQLNSSTRNPSLTSSIHDVNSKILHRQEHGSTSSNKGGYRFMPSIAHDDPIADSMESIEKGYVLVNAHFASMETLSSSLETSLQDNPAARATIYSPNKNDEDVAVAMKTTELTATSVGAVESPGTMNQIHLHHLLKDGQFLESFSVELVVLAIWKKAVQVCSSWLASTAGSDLPETSSTNESAPVQEVAGLSLNSQEEEIDFSKPSSVSILVESEFIAACDHAEKLSSHLQDMDGNSKMPDAMEIIFQAALAFGKSGAVDEYMENKGSAAALYSKAMLLLSFIVGEATLLPLNPPFSLTPANKHRIQRYIIYLESHLTRFQISQLPSK